MIKIIADNKIPFLSGLFDGIAEIQFLPAKEITNKTITDADALIIRTRTKCNADLLTNTNVKFIASATIGFDHIDTYFCKENNIKWTNAPGCNACSVVQYIESALLNLAQKYNFSLAAKTLGIVGVGNVGKRVIKIAEKLKMNVLLNDPPRQRNEKSTEFVSLENIQQNADIITIHAPLNRVGEDKTFHLVDSEFLRKVKKTAFVINSARGEIIDNRALKFALHEKKIAGAVLDVWENEPNLDLDLLSLVSFGTPHIAGYSTDAKANCTLSSFKSVCEFFNLECDNQLELSIPKPDKIDFEIDCEKKTEQQIQTEIINLAYDINFDDIRLRKSPQEFENLRNNYFLRRKLSVFNYKLLNSEKIVK